MPPSPLWLALEDVLDPEIPISLVDLGLIYGVRQEGGAVEVEMTYTATGCPCMSFIRMDIEERLLRVPGVESVRVVEVWDPPWTRARVSERGRARLRELGVSV
jgi:metal-sulfur cluster biosynthetic enzyme